MSKILGIATLAALAACVGMYLKAQSGTVGGSGTSPVTSSLVDANLVASASPSASTQQIQQTLDNMFALNGLNPTIADAYGITSQIATAQAEFNAGSLAPSSESNVVQAVNNLANTLGLPAYAQTSLSEVRQLHVAMIQASPHFIFGGERPSWDLKHRSKLPLPGRRNRPNPKPQLGLVLGLWVIIPVSLLVTGTKQAGHSRCVDSFYISCGISLYRIFSCYLVELRP